MISNFISRREKIVVIVEQFRLSVEVQCSHV